MAIDLTEAWGSEEPPVAPSPREVPSQPLQARPSSISARLASPPTDDAALVRILVHELAELKREQNRTAAICMVAICILFASVMHTLDKLQVQVRRLSEVAPLNPYH